MSLFFQYDLPPFTPTKLTIVIWCWKTGTLYNSFFKLVPASGSNRGFDISGGYDRGWYGTLVANTYTKTGAFRELAAVQALHFFTTDIWVHAGIIFDKEIGKIFCL